MAIRQVCGHPEVKEALGEPVTPVNTRSDVTFKAHSGGAMELKFGVGVRGPNGMAEAHITLGSPSHSERYSVKEIVVLCRDPYRRIEMTGAAMPDTLATALGISIALFWPVPIEKVVATSTHVIEGAESEDGKSYVLFVKAGGINAVAVCPAGQAQQLLFVVAD